MNSRSHNDVLFMPSGCLSPEAMEKYAGKQLSAEELILVEEHLVSCAFCRDAVEGASQVPGFAAHSSMINERLRSRFRYMPGRPRRSPPLSNFLLPAAASVIVLVGIIAWFHYFYPERQELAIVSDSIPVQMDAPELQEKSAAGKREAEMGEAATIGGVMNREESKSVRPPSVPEPLPGGSKQEKSPGATGADTGLIKNTGKEEMYADEAVTIEKNAEVMEREEKDVAGIMEQQPAVAKKSAEVTRQMVSGTEKSFVVEQEAEYPGGADSLQAFLIHTLQYPSEVSTQTDTTVIASFLITKKGNIRDITIVKSGGKAFDDEVIRVIRLMPAWIPATINGKAVAVTYNLPIRFEAD